MKPFIITVFILVLGFSTIGQTRKSAPKPPVTETEATTKDGKLLILKSDGTWRFGHATNTQPTTTDFKSKSWKELNAFAWVRYGFDSFVIKYDEFKNSTFAATAPQEADMLSSSNLKTSFAFLFDGDTLKAPPKLYVLYVLSKSSEWQYLKSNDLIFLVDGERIQLMPMTSDRDVKFGGVSENLIFAVSPQSLLKIANAKSVRFQLGSTEGKLADTAIKLAKALYEMSN